MATSRSGAGNGSGRSRTALTTEKMAVLAPMPSASATMATAANPGAFHSARAPYLMSLSSEVIWFNSGCRVSGAGCRVKRLSSPAPGT